MTRRSPVRFRSAPRFTPVHISDRRSCMELATRPETMIRQVGELSKNHSTALRIQGLVDCQRSVPALLDTASIPCLFANNCFSSRRHFAYEHMGRSLILPIYAKRHMRSLVVVPLHKQARHIQL